METQFIFNDLGTSLNCTCQIVIFEYWIPNTIKPTHRFEGTAKFMLCAYILLAIKKFHSVLNTKHTLKVLLTLC